jgi:hypothetical protein
MKHCSTFFHFRSAFHRLRDNWRNISISLFRSLMGYERYGLMQLCKITVETSPYHSSKGFERCLHQQSRMTQ